MFVEAVKLRLLDFSIETLIAVRPRLLFVTSRTHLIIPRQDCVELLLPDAATKLDLAYHIESDVPLCEDCRLSQKSAITISTRAAC